MQKHNRKTIPQLLRTTALASLAIMGYGARAYATPAGCISSGGATYLCQGIASTNQTINHDNASVSTANGFVISSASGNTIDISGYGALSFTDNYGATIDGIGHSALSVTVAADDGATAGSINITTSPGTTISSDNHFAIIASNHGTGGITLESNGHATSTNFTGVLLRSYHGPVDATINGDVTGGIYGVVGYMKSGSTGNLNITTGESSAITGHTQGVFVRNRGTGASDITVAGDVTSQTSNGIEIINDEGNTGGITVTTEEGSSVSGQTRGIYADNAGSGATDITVYGSVTATTYAGIRVLNRTTSTGGVSIETGENSSITGNYGISVRNNGQGDITATLDGYITSTEHGGVILRNMGTSSGSIDVTTAENSTIYSVGSALVAENLGTGTTSVSVDGEVYGMGDYGIYVSNTSIATGDITVDLGAHSSVTGDYAGLSLESNGSGNIEITTDKGSTVDGQRGILIHAHGASDTYLDIGGDVTSTSYSAIKVSGYAAAHDITLVTGKDSTIEGHANGIFVENNGHGHVAVTVDGHVSSATTYGVNVYNGPTSSGGVTIITGADSSITGHSYGILVDNRGAEATEITVDGTVTSATNAAIEIEGPKNATVTLQNGANVHGVTGIKQSGEQLDVTLDGSVHAVTLTGTGGTAAAFGSTDDVLTLKGAVTINGNITGGGQTTADVLNLDHATINLGTGDTISGFETVNVTGLSAVNGTFANSGTTTIDSGNFQVGDATHEDAHMNSDVNVAQGGTLSGHGTITGHVTNNGGTVSPGGSIGTLHVSGNYTQASAGNLAIEVSPTANSVLAVTGTASLDGTLTLTFNPGDYATKNYTFLTAGTVNGTFASVTGALPGFEIQDPVYTATTASFGILPAAPNDSGVFSNLTGAMIGNGHMASDTLFDHMHDAWKGMPNINTDVTFTSLVGKDMAPAENAKGLKDMAKALPQAMRNFGGWFKGIGKSASLASDGAREGFNSDMGGFMFGADTDMGKGMRVGAAGGYEHTALESNKTDTSNGESNSVRFALYGGKQYDNGIAVHAQAGYALHMIDTERLVAANSTIARSSHDGHEFSGGLQAVKNYLVEGFTLSPSVGVNYVHLFEEGYTETGGGIFKTTVDEKGTDSLRFSFGGNVARPINNLYGLNFTPSVRAKYSYEVLDSSSDTSAKVLGRAFSLSANHPSRHTFSIGTGFTAKLDDTLDAFGNYDVNLPTGNLFEHTFTAGVKFKF